MERLPGYSNGMVLLRPLEAFEVDGITYEPPRVKAQRMRRLGLFPPLPPVTPRPMFEIMPDHDCDSHDTDVCDW